MTVQHRIAVIGLGSMGMGIARSLLRAGHEVSGCDVNPDSRQSFAADGGLACNNPSDASQHASIAIIVVVNADQTDAVLFGSGGVMETLAADSVIVSCATMSPTKAKEFAGRVEAAGMFYLDAPISGGAAKAGTGELTVMASGSEDAFAAAEPALKAMATTVYNLGADAGIGSSFKIVNQHLAGVHIAAACEAITFAASMGLDISRVFDVITKSAGNSWMFENRIPHVLSGDYSPRSAVSIFTKDLGIVSDIGRAQKFPLPIASAALQLFIMTEAAGMGRDDDASVARLLADTAQIDLPKAEENA